MEVLHFHMYFLQINKKKARGIIQIETMKTQPMKRKEGKIMKKTVKEMRKKRNENRIMNAKRYIPGCTIEHQCARISEHPLQIGNMLVVDQIETKGILAIIKTREDETVYFQPTDHGYFVTGADMVGKISVSFMMNEKAVLINEINCMEGHEKLEKAMLEQVDFVAAFYHFNKVRILDSAYQK